MTRFVGLLGATGYTGRLVADELARRNVAHRRGGRNRARLDALPSAANAETYEVDAANPVELDAFLDGIDVLITTVGPFAELGLPVVDAAVRAGAHYVDSTGEPNFMAQVYERYDDAPVAVVPACGYDYMPADCAAALAAKKLGDDAPLELLVAYEVRDFRPSRGTAQSTIGAAGSAQARFERVSVEFPGGEKDAVAVPLGERLTVPRHVPQATVTTAVVAPSGVAAAADFLGPAAGALGAFMRGAGPLLRTLTGRMSEGPDEATRKKARFRILVEARRAGERARVLVEGNDIYRLTAVLLVEAALRVNGRGALAPAQAVEPRDFLDVVGASGLLSWRFLD